MILFNVKILLSRIYKAINDSSCVEAMALLGAQYFYNIVQLQYKRSIFRVAWMEVCVSSSTNVWTAQIAHDCDRIISSFVD